LGKAAERGDQKEAIKHASARRRAAGQASAKAAGATRLRRQSVQTRYRNEGRASRPRLVNNEATDTLRGFRISKPTLGGPEDAHR
jgi:hypothetical protein